MIFLDTCIQGGGALYLHKGIPIQFIDKIYGPTQYNHGMVIIVPIDREIQRIDKWIGVIIFLLFSFSLQTLLLFNEYDLGIFNYYKDSENGTNFEYVMREKDSRSNLVGPRIVFLCWFKK